MGEFTHRIIDLAARYGNPATLARITGLHPTIIWRLTKGKAPDRNTLKKLCQSVDDDAASSLLVAYLNDCIPEGCRALAHIESSGSRIHEGAGDYQAGISKLSRDVREAISHLVLMCIEDGDFGDYILKSVQYWDEDWARNQTVSTYAALESVVRDFQLPLLGEIPAGEPIVTTAREDDKMVTVGGDLLPLNLRSGAYALKVKGKSMERPGHAKHIPSGSTIIVVNREPQIGDVVVGLVDGTESTLKLLAEQDGEKLLRPLNPHPRFREVIPLEKMEVQGVFHCLA